MVKCHIDNEQFESIDDLHKHLRCMRMPLEKYYKTYFQRKDFHTQNLLPYESYESYFSSFFACRQNMVNWLKQNDLDITLPIIKEMFSSRKEAKNLIFTPSEIELRTSILPSRKWFKHVGINYYTFAKSLGFVNRFEEPENLNYQFISSEMTIIVDTREKKPIVLKQKTIREKVHEGDYSVMPPYFSNVYIERKSFIDLCGTMSSGYERFCKELDRAEKKGAYIIVLVEESIENVLEFSKEKELKYVKANKEFIFSRIKNIMQSYANIQFLFVNGRYECARYIPKIFSMKEQARKLELQVLYDGGVL